MSWFQCGECASPLDAAYVETWYERGLQGTPLCEPCRLGRRKKLRDARATQITAVLRDAGVMLEHLGAQFSDYDSSMQARIATIRQGWKQPSSKGLCLLGATGTGKTRLAVAFLRDCLLGMRTGRVMLMREVLKEVWGTYNDGSRKSEMQVVNELYALGLLVVDDLGTEGRASPDARSLLHAVLSKRSGDYRPTIVTSNLSPEDIGAQYGESIYSRIRAFDTIVLTGEDRRRQ